MELPSYFRDFLTAIRPTENQRQDLITGHRTLRERLNADETLSKIIVSMFLQGSYRRGTVIRPKGDKRSDVDLVVVTKLSEEDYPDPEEAMTLFIPFLDKHYKDKYELQGRSIGITLSYVDLDLVITSAPSEAEIGLLLSESVTSLDSLEEVDDWRLNQFWISQDARQRFADSIVRNRLDTARQEAEWKLSPLRIPDREAQTWEDTHPLAQNQWTRDKNKLCHSHYINVVKAIKWWRRVKHPTPKYPKGYPVEHLIGQCCPDEISYVATGVTLTLEAIESKYAAYAALKITPDLRDHGVPSHNVFKRVSGEDFAEFHAQVCEAAKIARQALDADTVYESARLWCELFGNKFPEAPENSSGREPDPSQPGGFTQRQSVSTVGTGRFA
jgi:Second Messenger Oligonucleotide or Dinucleotide Synthetase domain